jgi:subtilisin family serine protease
MWRIGLMVLGIALGVGCNVGARYEALETRLKNALLPAQPAWGERVTVESGQVKTIRVNYLDSLKTFALNPGQKVVDLPKSPANTDIPETDPSTNPPRPRATVSPEAYKTALDATAYTRRASVEMLDASGKVIPNLTLYPYGSVTVQQIEFLVSVRLERCDALFAYLNNKLPTMGVVSFRLSPQSEDKLSISLERRYDLCQGVVIVGEQTTVQALSRLEQALSTSPNLTNDLGFVVDKNTVMSLMQLGSVFDYDPDCGEIERKLDPIADNNFDFVTMAKLRTDINPTGAALTGSNVGVVVIGGGFDAQDQFDCRPDYGFAKHDTHIKDILDLLASGATVRPEVVCNASGTCKSSNVSKALMRTLSAPPKPDTLVNMSLGGPLPNKVMYALLKLLGQERKIHVITSSGNSPSAPAQYPASYAKGVASASEPMLSNVISVAAIGFRSGAYEVASFNTRKNANVFAPGVNLCTTSLLTKRCLVGGVYPQDIGVSGTSFSAPVVTAVSALLIQQTGKMPGDLLGCLEANLFDPSKAVSYPALMSKPCS